MGDPALLNCVLAVCCTPLSERQISALASMLVEDGICKDDEAYKIAGWMLKRYDLAPQGTLQAFKDAIAKEARGTDYQG